MLTIGNTSYEDYGNKLIHMMGQDTSSSPKKKQNGWQGGKIFIRHKLMHNTKKMSDYHQSTNNIYLNHAVQNMLAQYPIL